MTKCSQATPPKVAKDNSFRARYANKSGGGIGDSREESSPPSAGTTTTISNGSSGRTWTSEEQDSWMEQKKLYTDQVIKVKTLPTKA